MNLKQAIKDGLIDQFAAEHELDDIVENAKEAFEGVMDAIVGTASALGVSQAERRDGSDENLARQGTSKDASR